jgi:hypothetical protein
MLAGWAQVAALVVTAFFVWRYLQATEGLRETAQNQLATANRQLEAQIRPAVVGRWHFKSQNLMLQNVGNGAAFNLQLAKVDLGAVGNWNLEPNFQTFLNGTYLEPAVSPEENLHGAVGTPVFFARAGLQVRYESLSSKEYATVIDFDESGMPIRTRFFEKA